MAFAFCGIAVLHIATKKTMNHKYGQKHGLRHRKMTNSIGSELSILVETLNIAEANTILCRGDGC